VRRFNIMDVENLLIANSDHSMFVTSQLVSDRLNSFSNLHSKDREKFQNEQCFNNNVYFASDSWSISQGFLNNTKMVIHSAVQSKC